MEVTGLPSNSISNRGSDLELPSVEQTDQTRRMKRNGAITVDGQVENRRGRWQRAAMAYPNAEGVTKALTVQAIDLSIDT